jgi:uncharacterized membrane protein YphA (DoxX/SURF4 family)
MLLLRASVGLIAAVQGAFYLLDTAGSSPGAWFSGLFWLAAGVALFIGLLTPLVGVVVGLGALGVGFSILPATPSNLFDARLSVILTGIITAAIVFLGPGAFSLDARLFGRREIIIPHGPRRPKL